MKVTRLDLPVMASWMEENGRRLDCNPYLSGGFEARILLKKLDAEKQPLKDLTLGGMKGIFNGPRFSRHYVQDPEYGVPFLGSTDILAADLSGLPMISKKQVKARPELVIDQDWTLITCSGTIGRMVYSRADMKGMAGSQHFMRIVADRAKILPGYLYAYLSSRFGVALIVSGTYGSIIQHLEPSHIADLPVPRLGDALEQKIHDLISEAAELRSQYQSQVRQATDLLFSSVGLKDITASEWHQMGSDLGFMHNLGSYASLRAANFNPRFKQLCETVKSTSWKALGEICVSGTLKRGGRYKRIDAEIGHGCQLIGQRQLFWLRPEGRSVVKSALGDDVFVESGTSLVAARGTLGESELYCRAEFIIEPANEMAYSEDILRVVSNEEIMPKGCLFAFMRSESAFRMLRSISFGSKLQDHHYAFLPNLPVPYPERNIQEEIHELVMDAYKKRHNANSLEDQATALIHNAIEQI
jgi:hypothetical protein